MTATLMDTFLASSDKKIKKARLTVDEVCYHWSVSLCLGDEYSVPGLKWAEWEDGGNEKRAWFDIWTSLMKTFLSHPERKKEPEPVGKVMSSPALCQCGM